MSEQMTGYPSIDKPWLKYYSEEVINGQLPECSIYEYMYENNKEHPQDTALNYFGKKISYQKLFEMIEETAQAFNAAGVKPEEIVSVVTISTVASVVCFYAINKIGAVSNYLNVLAEEDDLIKYFKEASSKVVVTLDLFAKKVCNAAEKSGVDKVIVFSLDANMPMLTKIGYRMKTRKTIKWWKNKKNEVLWDEFLQSAKGKERITYKKNPHKLCLLAHTGGTTGEPKAVMLDDCALNAATSQYLSTFDATRGDIFLNLMIPFVVYGFLANIHVPLCFGLASVIIPKFQSQDWSIYINKYHPNHILATPAYVIPLLEDEKIKKMDISCLRSVGVGGDGLTKEKEEELNSLFERMGSSARMMPGYGLTEACATATGCFTKTIKTGSVGRPLPRYNAMIYDNDNKTELVYGEIGEVCLQCPSRMIGYMNNEEATKELFRIHDDGSEWLHTGDLGYIDEDGFLFLVGRMKRIILTAKDGIAYKVFPNIPEKILGEHPAVKQSCIVGAEDKGDQVLKAFVTIAENKRRQKDTIELELRRLCDEKLPSYSRPTFYVFCDSLPLTAAGKIDYKALENMNNE